PPGPPPPCGWASSASTGTVSTLDTLPVVISTVTGAWFSFPAAFGWVSETSTVTVADVPVPEPPEPELPEPELPEPAAPESEPDDEEEDDEEATRLICEITPGVTLPSGSVMLTWSPSLTSDCWAASRSMVTTGVVEDAVSTCDPGVAGPPSAAVLPRAVI